MYIYFCRLNYLSMATNISISYFCRLNYLYMVTNISISIIPISIHSDNAFILLRPCTPTFNNRIIAFRLPTFNALQGGGVGSKKLARDNMLNIFLFSQKTGFGISSKSSQFARNIKLCFLRKATVTNKTTHV